MRALSRDEEDALRIVATPNARVNVDTPDGARIYEATKRLAARGCVFLTQGMPNRPTEPGTYWIGEGARITDLGGLALRIARAYREVPL